MSRTDHQILTPKPINVPNTAPGTPIFAASNSWSPRPQLQRPVSRTNNSNRVSSRERNTNGRPLDSYPYAKRELHEDDSDDEMDGDRRPPLHRPTDGRSHQPLLHKDDEERGRMGYDASPSPDRPPLFSRRSTMRSRSPDTQARLATKKKYTYAAFFLGLSLVSFVVQTETAVYIQHELGWNKAYCMLFVYPPPPFKYPKT